MATAAVGLVQFRRQQVGPDSRERLSTDQIFAGREASTSTEVEASKNRGNGYGAASMGR